MSTKFNDIVDIVNIVNNACDTYARLNMYHILNDGVVYIRLTYSVDIQTGKEIPILEIYSELLFGDFEANRNGRKEKKIYCLRFTEPLSVNDLIELKGSSIEKIEYYINNDLSVQLII